MYLLFRWLKPSPVDAKYEALPCRCGALDATGRMAVLRLVTVILGFRVSQVTGVCLVSGQPVDAKRHVSILCHAAMAALECALQAWAADASTLGIQHSCCNCVVAALP